MGWFASRGCFGTEAAAAVISLVAVEMVLVIDVAMLLLLLVPAGTPYQKQTECQYPY